MRARIALVASLVALAACGDDDAATTTSTTAAGIPTTTTTTLAPLGDPVFTWTRLADDEPSLGGLDEQDIEAVIVGPDILVGVGAAKIDDDPNAAVWTSADGTSWSRVPDDEAIFGVAGFSQGMHAGVYFEGAFVAVGFDYAIGAEATAVVWRSTDGQSWSRVAHDEAVFGGTGSQIMLGVTEGGPGLVAVGWDASGGEPDGAVWTSADGLTWTRVPHDETVFGGAESQTIYSVITGGPGLVAVGHDNAAGDFDAVVWVSTDGLTWERVPDPDGVFGGVGEQRMTAVYPEGSPMIATGVAGVNVDHDGLVWISGDGTSWDLVSAEEFAGPENEFLSALVRFEGLVVLAGSEYSEATDTEIPVIWYSTDHGLSWVRADDAVPSDAQYVWVESLTLLGDSLLAVGGIGTDEDFDVAVWTIEVTFE